MSGTGLGNNVQGWHNIVWFPLPLSINRGFSGHWVLDINNLTFPARIRVFLLETGRGSGRINFWSDIAFSFVSC